MTEAAIPWGTIREVVGEPLHPGGRAATADLLDRAGVEPGTRLLDIGCGAGEALAAGRERGAIPVGVDHNPSAGRAVCGEMTTLPVRDAAIDVALSECTLCLAADLDAALGEAHRVLAPGGRLALSDVVTDGETPDLPERLETALCLSGRRDTVWLEDRLSAAGFQVRDRRDHREELLAMRDRLAGAVDYRGLLRLAGETALLDGVNRLEQAVEDGTMGYVSIVATADR